MILFLAAPLPAELHAPLCSFRTAMDEAHIHGRDISWLCRGKTSASLVNWPLMSKQVALPVVTVRNATTIRKLVNTPPKARLCLAFTQGTATGCTRQGEPLARPVDPHAAQATS